MEKCRDMAKRLAADLAFLSHHGNMKPYLVNGTCRMCGGHTGRNPRTQNELDEARRRDVEHGGDVSFFPSLCETCGVNDWADWDWEEFQKARAGL